MAASPRRSAWPALALVVGSATISLGCHVHTVEIDEFAKAEGGATCLSLLFAVPDE